MVSGKPEFENVSEPAGVDGNMMTSLASIYFYYCKSTVERHSI